MVFLGIDWAESHHDVCLVNEIGEVLFKKRITDDLAGFADLQAELARFYPDPDGVVVGIETSRGLLVRALSAAGYTIYAINPLAVSRYRERSKISGAKSDSADARLLADLVRTDRHRHRPLQGDSQLAQAVKILARSQKSFLWSRQHLLNQMRNTLREYYPGALVAFGTHLESADALAVLERAPTPALGRALTESQIVAALKRGGRLRNLESTAAKIRAALRTPQLEQPDVIAEAFAATIAAAVPVVRQFNAELLRLEAELARSFERHPDAEIYRSLPGLGILLGARVLGEFGDSPTRFANAKARRNYARTSPITKASGAKEVVFARFRGNNYLADACPWWAFVALSCSPGTRSYYDGLRARGKSKNQALRSVANKLVGILHGCLRTHTPYSEEVAWSATTLAA